MALFAFDTETTGLKVMEGDKIIELAAVEITRDPNPRTFHSLVNPLDRDVSPEALAIHGISNQMLVDAPSWDVIYPRFLDFLGEDATLVIHNAPFDLDFLRGECDAIDLVWPEFPVIDTLKEAIKAFPGARHNLDALCRRFGIDLSQRQKHGALIDTQLLQQLYLAWFGQQGFDLSVASTPRVATLAVALGSMNNRAVPIPTGTPRPTNEIWGDYDSELSQLGL